MTKRKQSDYDKVLNDIVSEQAAILDPLSGSKENYFRVKGLSDWNTVLSLPSHKMISRARDLWEKGNYESALVLADLSKNDKFWLHTIAGFYEDKEAPFYDIRKAYYLYKESAESGLHYSKAKMAQLSFEGAITPPDTKLALYWLEDLIGNKKTSLADRWDFLLSIMPGKRGKYLFGLNLLLSSRELAEAFYNHHSTFFGSERNLYFQYVASTLLVRGYGVEKNESLAIQHYEDIVGSASDDIGTYPLRALVVRYTLGLGVKPDIEKAKKLLVDNPEMRCDCLNYYEPLNELLEHMHENEYQAAAQYIRDSYQRDNGAQKVIEDLSEGNITASRAKFLLINAMKILARTENWSNANDWVSTFYYARLVHNDFDPEKIMSDTWRLGPFYNAVSETGLPILGAIQDEHFDTPGMYNGEPIEPGIIAFTGLTATSKGELKLHFTESATDPAFLLQEDVDVAMALAFGRDKFQWPSIDMPMHKANDGDLLEEAQLKDIKPEWLRETPIGPTLYITDFLGGRLSWATESFEVANNDLGHTAYNLLKSIEDIEVPNPTNNQGKFINVNPKDVDLNTLQTTKDDTTRWDITVGRIELRISGGYSMKGDTGDKLKWHFKDDLQYRHIKVCASLTENFDIIAQVLPVYERLRQFVGLVYALNELRSQGFKPNAKLQSLVEQKHAEFEARVADKEPEYARSLPLQIKPEIGC